MSHFFSTTKEDSFTPKKYQSDSSEEEKQSKKTSKKTLINQEILEAQTNPSNKSVEKVIKSVQKNKNHVTKQQLLNFYTLISKAKKVSLSTKNKLKEIVDHFGEEVKIELKKEKRKISLQEEIIEILNFTDLNEKIAALEKLNSTNKSERFKILQTKVLVYLQNNILTDLITCFKEMKEIFKEESLIFNDFDLKKLFVSQVGMYFNYLMNYKEDALINETADLLRDINKEVVERKLLEYNYFVKNNCIFTESFDFKMLYFIKNDKLEECISFYEENKEIFNLEEEIIRKGMIELGKQCFLNKKYSLSFEILQKVYYSDNTDISLEEILLVNCVLIPSELKNEKFFEYFLNSFLSYENEMLLESCKTKNEIFRAFFYKENGMFNKAEDVLFKCGYEVEIEKKGTFI